MTRPSPSAFARRRIGRRLSTACGSRASPHADTCSASSSTPTAAPLATLWPTSTSSASSTAIPPSPSTPSISTASSSPPSSPSLSSRRTYTTTMLTLPRLVESARSR